MSVPYLKIGCRASCDPQDQLTLCSEQHPEVCPANTTCNQSMVLGAGYKVCFNNN